MIPIARKNLFSEKTRFIASISGVAFSILLIIVLIGVYNAFANLSTIYVDNMDADIVVAQEGVMDMLHSFSILRKERVSQIERITGGKAYGIVSRTTQATIAEKDGSKIIDFPGRLQEKNTKGKKETISVIGFDTKSKVGGPWINIKGNNIPGKGEIVIDKILAAKTGLSLRDQIEIAGKIFTITGITDKNNLLVYTRAFINIDDAQDILKEKDLVSFILVQLPNSSQAKEVAESLKKQIGGISAYTVREFAISNGKMITDSFLPIILVITIIGFLTGVVVVGLTVYTATMEKLSEFGVLKAIGASNSTLFLVVFEQAIWSSIFGFILGVIGSLLVAKAATDFVPVMIVETNEATYIFAFITALIISIVASYLPIKKISTLDPAIVFKK